MVTIENEISKKIRHIKTKLLRLQMIQNLETNAAFMDIEAKISENLDKLRLGSVKQAVNTFMPMLLNKNLDHIKIRNSLKLTEITDEIEGIINEIFMLLSKGLNISEEERRALLDTPEKEKENITE